MAVSAKPNQFVVWSLVIVICVIVAIYTFYKDQIDAATPSWFHSHLIDQSFLVWRRWHPLTFSETICIYLAILAPFILLRFSKNPFSNYLFNLTYGVRRHIFLVTFISATAIFLYAPLVGGYAIYNDHIQVFDPMRTIQTRSYGIKDIDHIEIGCHERFELGKRSPNLRAPSYKIVFRNGQILSIFDLVNEEYDSPQLMQAVLSFDQNVQASLIPRSIRKNVFKSEMNDADCFTRMENAYDETLTPAIRKTFEHI